MQRLKAGCFLILSVLITLPGFALALARVRGVDIAMDPMAEAMVWMLMLGGGSTATTCIIMLLRGR